MVCLKNKSKRQNLA